MEHSILIPKIDVQLRDGTVSVHELKWGALFQMLQQLGTRASEFITVDDDKAKMSLSVEKIGSVISGSEDLTKQLILGATGKDEAWLKERHLGEVLELLDAALNINLSDSIVDRIKKIASRLRNLFAAEPAKTNLARS